MLGQQSARRSGRSRVRADGVGTDVRQDVRRHGRRGHQDRTARRRRRDARASAVSRRHPASGEKRHRSSTSTPARRASRSIPRRPRAPRFSASSSRAPMCSSRIIRPDISKASGSATKRCTRSTRASSSLRSRPSDRPVPYRDWKGTDLIEFAMSLTGYNTPTMVDDAERENPLRAPGPSGRDDGRDGGRGRFDVRDFPSRGDRRGPMDRRAMLAGDRQHLEDRDGGLHLRRNSVQPDARQRRGRASNRCHARTATSTCCGRPIPTTRRSRRCCTIRRELESEVFDKLLGRQQNDDVLRPMIREELLKYDTEYLVREGQRLGLTIGPVFTVAQAAQPSASARAQRVRRDRSSGRGPLRVSASLVHDDRDAADARRARRCWVSTTRKSSDASASRARSSRGCAPPA